MSMPDAQPASARTPTLWLWLPTYQVTALHAIKAITRAGGGADAVCGARLVNPTLPWQLERYNRQPAQCSRCESCDSSGCDVQPPSKVFLLVPVRDSLYAAARSIPSRQVQVRRCDTRGCDPVDVNVIPTGTYISLVDPLGGYLVKLAAKDMAPARKGDFLEMMPFFLGGIISFGRCAWPNG